MNWVSGYERNSIENTNHGTTCCEAICPSLKSQMQKVQWRARKAFEKEGERIILVIDEKG
jgi:hypothetical protein